MEVCYLFIWLFYLSQAVGMSLAIAFSSVIDDKGGFVSAHWDGTTDTELKIKEETAATIRCIPLDNVLEGGKCILTGKPSIQRVLFAKAY